MDIRMPEMDGVTSAKRIRELERQDANAIPIIAMSANAFNDDIKKSIDAGMDKHLTKPIDPRILFETLAELIDKHSNVNNQKLVNKGELYEPKLS